MTIKNTDDLIADINADLADNVSGDISPADMRSNLINLVESLRPTQILFFNDTGVTIPRGSVINITSIHVGSGLMSGALADVSDPTVTGNAVIGLCSDDVLDQIANRNDPN